MPARWDVHAHAAAITLLDSDAVVFAVQTMLERPLNPDLGSRVHVRAALSACLCVHLLQVTRWVVAWLRWSRCSCSSLAPRRAASPACAASRSARLLC